MTEKYAKAMDSLLDDIESNYCHSCFGDGYPEKMMEIAKSADAEIEKLHELVSMRKPMAESGGVVRSLDNMTFTEEEKEILADMPALRNLARMAGMETE